MIRILFVCHGNICRSPMAEYIMKDIVHRHGMDEMFYIASAATSTEEIWNGMGNPVYPPAQKELAKHGISCDSHKRAVQLKKADYDSYDYLIGMDTMNLRNMENMTGHKASEKMCLLLDFTGEHRSVSDPWYSDRFDIAYNDILRGCEAFFSYLNH